MRSHVQFLPDHLANWFNTLDTASAVAPVIRRLESGLDFKSCRKQQEAESSGMGGTLTWPNDPEKRLGMKLLLFRSAVTNRSADLISWFGFVFIPSPSGRNINNAARRFLDQVFWPMSRELLQEANKVPAADRVVHLDHNSSVYRQAIEALEKLEEALREANDYPDAEDKEQRIAEISATQRLLKSVRVRVAAVVTVIGSGLAYLASHFVGYAIDAASHGVIEKLTALLGAYF